MFETARMAWEFIAGNFVQGDKIFIFGFSRGAFAARHLAGMIVRYGLHGWSGEMETIFRDWLVDVSKPCTLVKQTVDFLGLFDCVPGNQFFVWRDQSSHLNSPILEPGIQCVRHAVAMNELRWSFKPLIFCNCNSIDFAQHWFPGCHSDVGGGDKVAIGLSSFSQWWMMREAYGKGLDFSNISCPHYRNSHAMSVLSSVDPSENPVCTNYLTTRLGLRLDRAKDATINSNIKPPLKFYDLDVCPRCNHEMFDIFLTDYGQKWLISKGFIKNNHI